MVENPEPKKSKEIMNGGEDTYKSKEKDRSLSSKHRSEGNDNDLDQRTNHSRSRDDSRDSRKERSSGHLPSSRDREKSDNDRHKDRREHRNRDKEEGSGKDKDRERGKERDSDKNRESYRDGDRREHGREYGRERDREGERERSRGNKSYAERNRDDRERERSRDMERSIVVDFKEKGREREFRDRDHESRRYKEKKKDVEKPEADPERDQRTVFAYQISLKAAERDVYEFFSKAGKVRDVHLIMDRNSRRSKGIGYIEFYDVMSVPMAIALSGQPLLGVPVMVKPSEAEKNLVQSTTSVVSEDRKLYVGNLPVTIKEDQLRQVFEPFGSVELVQLPTDPETANCKGYGFVQFSRLEDAKAAQNLNGQLEIAGRVIKVSAVTDQAAMQDAGANVADFDDIEGNGLSLNAHSRALLMQKLDRTGTASSIAGSLGTPIVNNPGLSLPTAPVLGAAPVVSSLIASLGQAPVPALAGLAAEFLSVPAAAVPSIDTIGVPSECLLLKNMFDPKLETEPDFDLDIKEDVRDECLKFGTLKHIFVDKNTAGFVYLRFENTQSAIAAQQALHGRWFAGKMITATYLLPQNYEDKFPDSRGWVGLGTS
ncbi:Splicing factor [Forsythia ovata]|uniref:Splicing factor n=1 Tax=Forsythia ovata TaxID=205694 RepID=A0ABD1QN69_9LAMI